jgi:tetratricopeptide (TPR) repeat protein
LHIDITTITEGFQSIAKILKIAVSPMSSMLIESVKDYLATQSRWLLIIDNADDPRLDLWQFMPQGKESSVLITTRNPGAEKYATRGSSSVEMMTENDATTLLLKVSRCEDVLAAGHEFSAKQLKRREAALEIVTTLGFLALAIVQAGAVIGQGLVGLDGFCALYAQRRKELLECGHPKLDTEKQRSVYTTWEISIKMIEEVNEQHSALALDMLRIFAFMHFDGITEKTLEAAWLETLRSKASGDNFFTTRWSLNIPDIWDPLLMGKALGLLLSFSLISMDADRRISLHPLVHQWSLERMSQVERQEVWIETILTLTAAINWSPGTEGVIHRKALLPHLDACLEMYPLNLSENHARIGAHVRAALAFSVAYRQNNRVHDSIRLTKGCLDNIESNLPASQFYHNATLKYYANDLQALGKYDRLVKTWQEIVELERQHRADSETIAGCLVSNATANILAGNPQQAMDLCNATLAEFQGALGNNNMAVMGASEVIGYAKRAMGEKKQALKHLERCLENHVQMNTTLPSFQELNLVKELVSLYIELKQFKKALWMAERKIEINSQIYGPDDWATKSAIVGYEETRAASGIMNIRRRAKCIAITEKAYNIARQGQGDPSIYTLFCMEQLADAYFDSGLIEKARVVQQQIVAHYVAKGGELSLDTVASMKHLQRIERYIRLRKAVYWWVPKALREKDWISEKLER